MPASKISGRSRMAWLRRLAGKCLKLLFANKLLSALKAAWILSRWDSTKLRGFVRALKRSSLTYTTDYPYHGKVREWDSLPGGNIYSRGLAAGDSEYESTLETFLRFTKDLSKIPMDAGKRDSTPRWRNAWLDIGDEISIYCLLAVNNPELYLEVGSGNSTKFARRAIVDHGLRTKIVSIDPKPRVGVDVLCDRVVRKNLESADLSIFGELGGSGMLFMDCSHRSLQNSDVTVFFTEILPFLGPGTIWGLHDIYLPFDYPEKWVDQNDRYYNEQYLLMAYLLGQKLDVPLLPLHYLWRCRPEFYAPMIRSFATPPPWLESTPNGSAFWMRRTTP